MTDMTLVIMAMAIATISIRLAGVAVGQKLPRKGAWAAALNALPGCLIVSLVSVTLVNGGPREWLAGIVAAVVATWSRNLPLTMAAGISAVWALREFA